MPTASSTQVIISMKRMNEQIKILYFLFCMFLIAVSMSKPKVNNKIPAIKKSNKVQFTSCVKNIAVNGMSNSNAARLIMKINLLFSRCIIG